MDVELYTTEHLSGSIPAGESSFTINLDSVAHVVDDIVVKSVSYYNRASSGDELIFLKSDLLAGKTIIAFPESVSLLEKLDNSFRIKPARQFSGSYSFYLRRIDGTPYTSDGTLELALCVCFIKRK